MITIMINAQSKSLIILNYYYYIYYKKNETLS